MKEKIVLHGLYVDRKGERFVITGLRPAKGRALVKSESRPDEAALSMPIAFLESALTRVKKERKK